MAQSGLTGNSHLRHALTSGLVLLKSGFLLLNETFVRCSIFVCDAPYERQKWTRSKENAADCRMQRHPAAPHVLVIGVGEDVAVTEVRKDDYRGANRHRILELTDRAGQAAWLATPQACSAWVSRENSRLGAS